MRDERERRVFLFVAWVYCNVCGSSSYMYILIFGTEGRIKGKARKRSSTKDINNLNL
jgi:hypothetical protein